MNEIKECIKKENNVMNSLLIHDVSDKMTKNIPLAIICSWDKNICELIPFTYERYAW